MSSLPVEVAAISWMMTLWLTSGLPRLLGDVGEQSVLDAVPLAGAGRQMDDRHGEARLVGEALQLAFPQMNAGAVLPPQSAVIRRRAA